MEIYTLIQSKNMYTVPFHIMPHAVTVACYGRGGRANPYHATRHIRFSLLHIGCSHFPFHILHLLGISRRSITCHSYGMLKRVKFSISPVARPIRYRNHIRSIWSQGLAHRWRTDLGGMARFILARTFALAI